MGLFKEVENLKKYQELNPLRSVGYSEIFSYLKGKISKKEAIDLIKINTWRYSKRQITWFKRNKDIQWYRSSTELVKDIKNQYLEIISEILLRDKLTFFFVDIALFKSIRVGS